MTCVVAFGGRSLAAARACDCGALRAELERRIGVPAAEQRLVSNGRELCDTDSVPGICATQSAPDRVAPPLSLGAHTSTHRLSLRLRSDACAEFCTLKLRVCGGKGGFGALLRASKKKVKTTNFGCTCAPRRAPPNSLRTWSLRVRRLRPLCSAHSFLFSPP